MALIIENDVIKKYVPEPGEDVILIPDTVKEIAENVFYRCGNIKEVIICGNDLVIGRGAFAYCTSLQSVTFRGTIRSIRGKKDFPVEGSAMAPFECCSALETVNFEGKIGSMGGAVFMDCNSLRSLVIRGEINYFGGSFISEDYYGLDGSYLGCVENCKNLEEVIIEGSINVMGLCAFKQCYSLKKIHIKGNIGHIGGEILTRDPYWGYSIIEPFPAVSICGELSGESILHIIIDGDVGTISSEAFAFCPGLKSVEISGTVATIGESAFCSCSSLESVIISGEVGEIKEYAFRECSKLEKILINGTVKNIKNRAFSNLSSLVKMEYPAKVHEIEWLAFDLCEKLVVEVDNIPLIGSKHLMQQADVVKNRNYSNNFSLSVKIPLLVYLFKNRPDEQLVKYLREDECFYNNIVIDSCDGGLRLLYENTDVITEDVIEKMLKFARKLERTKIVNELLRIKESCHFSDKPSTE